MRPRRRPLAGSAVGSETDRGAVLVEFTFVAMLLAVILAGTFDYGMAWRGGLGVTEGARAGARIGSAVGPDLDADRTIMTGVRATLGSAGLLDQVERVAIFRSDAEDGEVPAGCKTASSGACSVFSGADVRSVTATSPIRSDGCLQMADPRSFCPTSRNNVQADADYIGIWIRVRYEFQFGLLGSTQTIERTSIMRLEPQDLK